MSTIPIPCCGSSFRLFFLSKFTFIPLARRCILHIHCNSISYARPLFFSFCLSRKTKRNREARLGDASCKEYAVYLPSRKRQYYKTLPCECFRQFTFPQAFDGKSIGEITELMQELDEEDRKVKIKRLVIFFKVDNIQKIMTLERALSGSDIDESNSQLIKVTCVAEPKWVYYFFFDLKDSNFQRAYPPSSRRDIDGSLSLRCGILAVSPTGTVQKTRSHLAIHRISGPRNGYAHYSGRHIFCPLFSEK